MNPEKATLVRLKSRAKLTAAGVAVIVVVLAIALYVRVSRNIPVVGPRDLTAVAPGAYASPTPGIVSVKGECTGKLTLTPSGSHYQMATTYSYPLVYDCAAKNFTVLKALPDLILASDLTLTSDGYYLHEMRFAGDIQVGSYFFYDHDGKQVRELPQPEDLKVHDMILGDRDATLVRYVDDWDSARCGVPAPLGMEIVRKSFSGEILWKWSTKGHFSTAERVSTDASMFAPAQSRQRRVFSWLRNCYTSIAGRLVKFDVPKGLIFPNGGALFALEEDDYAHINSIQRLEPSGDLLASARHLDTIFRIDEKTGDVKWMLGGKFSKATPNRPIGDPRGGFSHQHYARIVGNRLWVFDNGNLFPDLPSRAVAYQLDSEPPNRLVFEFKEPNGKQRYSLGSVQPLANHQLLIGWGAVNDPDLGAPQRAVSIVDTDDGREVFSIDMAPGWISYRVKAAQQ